MGPLEPGTYYEKPEPEVITLPQTTKDVTQTQQVTQLQTQYKSTGKVPSWYKDQIPLPPNVKYMGPGMVEGYYRSSYEHSLGISERAKRERLTSHISRDFVPVTQRQDFERTTSEQYVDPYEEKFQEEFQELPPEKKFQYGLLYGELAEQPVSEWPRYEGGVDYLKQLPEKELGKKLKEYEQSEEFEQWIQSPAGQQYYEDTALQIAREDMGAGPFDLVTRPGAGSYDKAYTQLARQRLLSTDFEKDVWEGLDTQLRYRRLFKEGIVGAGLAIPSLAERGLNIAFQTPTPISDWQQEQFTSYTPSFFEAPFSETRGRIIEDPGRLSESIFKTGAEYIGFKAGMGIIGKGIKPIKPIPGKIKVGTYKILPTSAKQGIHNLQQSFKMTRFKMQQFSGRIRYPIHQKILPFRFKIQKGIGRIKYPIYEKVTKPLGFRAAKTFGPIKQTISRTSFPLRFGWSKLTGHGMYKAPPSSPFFMDTYKTSNWQKLYGQPGDQSLSMAGVDYAPMELYGMPSNVYPGYQPGARASTRIAESQIKYYGSEKYLRTEDILRVSRRKIMGWTEPGKPAYMRTTAMTRWQATWGTRDLTFSTREYFAFTKPSLRVQDILRVSRRKVMGWTEPTKPSVFRTTSNVQWQQTWGTRDLIMGTTKEHFAFLAPGKTTRMAINTSKLQMKYGPFTEPSKQGKIIQTGTTGYPGKIMIDKRTYGIGWMDNIKTFNKYDLRPVYGPSAIRPRGESKLTIEDFFPRVKTADFLKQVDFSIKGPSTKIYTKASEILKPNYQAQIKKQPFYEGQDQIWFLQEKPKIISRGFTPQGYMGASRTTGFRMPGGYALATGGVSLAFLEFLEEGTTYDISPHWKQRIDSKTKTFDILKPDTKTDIFNVNIVSPRIDTSIRPDILSIPKTEIDTMLGQAQIPTVRQDIRQGQRQMPMQLQKLEQKLRQETRLKTQYKTQQKRTPKTKLTILPLPMLPDGTRKETGAAAGQGYQVYIKTRQYYKGKPRGPEKYRRLSRTVYDYNDAKSIMGHVLDNSVAQQGYIKPINKPISKKRRQTPMDWTGLEHKFNKRDNKYIETRMHAIDTIGEKQQLNAFKVYKNLPINKVNKIKTLNVDMYEFDKINARMSRSLRRMRI